MPAPTNLKVRVEGIQEKGGEIGVALYNQKKGFPIELEHAYEAKWIPLKGGERSVSVHFESIPAGEYAVSVLHDENGNRKLERSTLGFPKEGVSFSNNRKVKLSAPKFKKCKFLLEADKEIITQLDYRK